MFEWNNSYSVGVTSIDAQHRNLFAISSELHAAMATGQGKAVLGRILERLIRYTEAHFAHEERLMQRHKYPELRAHAAEHQALAKQVRQFQAEFEIRALGRDRRAARIHKNLAPEPHPGIGQEVHAVPAGGGIARPRASPAGRLQIGSRAVLR